MQHGLAHTHTPAHSGGAHIVLLKSHSVMHIISHLKHLTSLNWKTEEAGREQKAIMKREGEWEGNGQRGKAYGETG